ncbi:hypothetical protein [Solimonas sp. SE-A11]|uniref:hypothetical protein n=1 Tax=Solimonas sp. SE-A11 TaxID=3054954 RepID=UPI00259C9B07|nr:hypothetical protein [Solimonas sp. SE-A11]MDM4771515.1 hypothetical protein [Solimonas sp. SE-A11]
MKAVGGIELHYYLAGEAHSIDAVVRNRCEAELIGIFQEVSNVLGISCQIDAQALAEGGVREIWKWIGENGTQLGVVLPVIVALLALMPHMYESEEEALSKELTELNIEEKKLQIEKLQKELREMSDKSANSVREQAIEVLKRDPKIVVRRSNFYKNLLGKSNIQGIGLSPLNSNLSPTQSERRIPKGDFGRFVLSSHSVRPLTIEDAKIEIVSPVLREGNYKWKGIYNNQTIGFSMQDLAFKQLVLREAVTFQHGTFLECVLNIHRKLDEVGELEITDYVVATVLQKHDGSQSIETTQGRAYKHAKKLRDSQEDLFSDKS